MGKAADKHRATAKKLRTIPGEGIAYGVKTVRGAALKAARSDTGGDLKLSGLKSGKALTVAVKRSSSGTLETADISAGPRSQRAPWFWMEEGTRAGARPLKRKGKGVVTYQHPGTKGKKTWSRSVAPALAETRAEFARLHGKAVS